MPKRSSRAVLETTEPPRKRPGLVPESQEQEEAEEPRQRHLNIAKFMETNSRVYKCTGFVFQTKNAFTDDMSELSDNTMRLFGRRLKMEFEKKLAMSIVYDHLFIEDIRPGTKSLVVRVKETVDTRAHSCTALFLHGSNKRDYKGVSKLDYEYIVINGDTKMCEVLLEETRGYMSTLTSVFKFTSPIMKQMFAFWTLGIADAIEKSSPLTMVLKTPTGGYKIKLELQIETQQMKETFIAQRNPKKKVESAWNHINEELYRRLKLVAAKMDLLKLTYPNFSINNSGQLKIKTKSDEFARRMLNVICDLPS